MGGRNTALLIASLGLVLAFAGPAAAQTQQNVAEIDGHLIETPEALPGMYEAVLEITIQNQWGACACSQSTMTLEIVDSGLANEAVLSPAGYTVHWLENAREGHPGTDTETVRLLFHVPESAAGAGMSKITVDGFGTTDSPAAHVSVLETQIAFPLPGEDAVPTQDASDADSSNRSARQLSSPTASPDNLEAASQSAGTSEAGLAGSLSPVLAGLLSAAVAGVVLVRRG